MPVNVDELKTVMAVAGQQNYMAAMWQAAWAAQNLERTTVHANRAMGESADAYFDKMANRWRDAGSGQFLGQKNMLGGNPALLMATALAAEVAVLAAALRLAASAFREVTTAGREFEAAMKDVEVQSGAAGDEMERIRQAALAPELVALGVGGKEAALAYKELASYGYSAAEMQAAMLPIMRAAVATGADMAGMTRAMLGIMNQYKLSIKDMPAIADAMSAALNKTSFQMNDFMLSMKYAGPIAGAMGWSLGETAAVLDQLNRTFVNAEMTGTGFRGFMNALLAPSNETAAAFRAAGLDVADFQKVMGDAGATLQWFQSGNWNSALIMQAFGAEAGNAATVLWQANIPAVVAAGNAINTTGNVAKDAETKMNSLDGKVKQLAASYEDAKIKLYNLTQGLSVDFVSAVKLALDAVSAYLTETGNQLANTDGKMKNTKDRVLEMAEAFIKGSAIIARGALQVSRVLALQGVWMTNLAATYNVARLGYLELAYAWNWVTGNDEGMKATSIAMDRAKAAIAQQGEAERAMMKWALGGGATEAIKGIDKFEEDMLQRVREMRDKALKDAANGNAGGGTALPPKNPKNQPKQDVRPAQLDAAKEQLSIDLKRLKVWEQMALAQTLDPVQEARITLAAREREVQLYRQMEEAAYRIGLDEKSKQEATIAREQAEAEYATARKNVARDVSREQDQQRMKTARDMDKFGDKAKAVGRAVQAVIGGRLSEQVKEQLDRLSGAELGGQKGFLRNAALLGNNKIVLELRYPTQITPQERAQTTGWLLDAIRDAGRRAPVGG